MVRSRQNKKLKGASNDEQQRNYDRDFEETNRVRKTLF